MTTFRVGMKVACVDAGPTKEIHPAGGQWNAIPLKKGVIYTILALADHPMTGMPGCLLNEIRRPLNRWRGETYEPPFGLYRFRPLVTGTQEQDVGTFLHIANHIDPIIRADEYRQEMEESEARLERLWTAMRSFEL